MASILGIELDGDVGREMRLGKLVVVSLRQRHSGFGADDFTASARIYDGERYEPLLECWAAENTESEAIAALEAKVRRLPGVLAVLGAEEK